MIRTFSRVSFFAVALLSAPAQAAVYSDDLSKCMVEKTSVEDRTALVKWVFSAAAAHPAVASIANVTPEQLDASNQLFANLFLTLLTESCREQAKKALKYEGSMVIPTSFQVLGQVAAGELFSSPEVKAAMSGLAKYADYAKFKALLEETAPAAK